MSTEVLTEMVGRTFVAASGAKGDDEMLFTDKDGRWVRFFHEQSCYESVTIEDVCGDLSDLLGTPILRAEQVVNSYDESDTENVYSSYTWTFYKFATIKGSVTARWLGKSNGYYSESVTIVTSEKPRPW